MRPSSNVQLQQMRQAWSQLPLDLIEIHAPTFDCDINIGRDTPTLAYQYIRA